MRFSGMKPGDIHAYFQPENAPDNPVIFMLGTTQKMPLSKIEADTKRRGR
jgi:hypothetical protein